MSQKSTTLVRTMVTIVLFASRLMDGEQCGVDRDEYEHEPQTTWMVLWDVVFSFDVIINNAMVYVASRYVSEPSCEEYPNKLCVNSPPWTTNS